MGMAYGVTSTTLLLAVAGLTPALASTVVHISEVGTCLMSGVSHWRFRNVVWSKIVWLSVPGAIGAFVGAVVFVKVIYAVVDRTVLGIFLFLPGAFLLAPFWLKRTDHGSQNPPI